jgi:hypothetical protein
MTIRSTSRHGLRAAGAVMATATALLSCHEDKETAPEASASAAVTPMGMASAAALTATGNTVETLVKGHHPKEVVLGKDQLFFADAQDDSPGAAVQVIVSAPLAGGASQPAFQGQLGAEGLAFANGRLVWITAPSDDQKKHSNVMSANLGAKPAVVTRTYDLDETFAISDGTNVFTFGDAKDSKTLSADLLRVGNNGKATAVTTAGPKPIRTALAANSTHVLWVQDGAIVRAPKTGGDAAVVVKLSSLKIQRMAADDTAVFWTDLGTGDPAWSGRVYRAAFADGKIETVSDASTPSAVALDADTVYWTSSPSVDGRVMARKKSGGATFILAHDLHEPRGLAVDDKYVYWVNAGDGAVCRVEKAPRTKP